MPEPARRKHLPWPLRVLNWLGCLTIIVVPISCGYGLYYDTTLRPPANVQSFEDYVAWEQPVRSITITGNSPRHLVVFGPTNIYTLASGPSAYIFDTSGKLVQFTTDFGDSGLQDQYKSYGPGSVALADLSAARQWLTTQSPTTQTTTTQGTTTQRTTPQGISLP